ncbi:MAG: transposase [Nitrospira sp.]|nr:transposase [Nitrospira sp.]
MTRPLRIECPGAVYPVRSRGNARQDIVAGDRDRQAFLDLLAHVVDRFSWCCHAYCVMDNHYHLLIETPQPNLSRGMRQLNGRYTQSYNRRHHCVGHLFQGRFTAILVEKEAHLRELCRYVVLNPVRAKLVTHPRRWGWSSYRATVGEAPSPPWLPLEWVLGQFGQRVGSAQAQYRAFVAEGRDGPRPWELLTGQLYLGSEEFIARHQPNRVIRDIPRRQTQPQMIYEAYRKHGYRLAEIAAHLGVYYATVSRRLKQAERSKVRLQGLTLIVLKIRVRDLRALHQYNTLTHHPSHLQHHRVQRPFPGVNDADQGPQHSVLTRYRSHPTNTCFRCLVSRLIGGSFPVCP